MEIEIFRKHIAKGVEVVRWNNKSGEVKIILVDKDSKKETIKQVYTCTQENC